MKHQRFKRLIQELPLLSHQQEAFVQQKLQHRSNLILDNLAAEIDKHHRCIHCENSNIRKYGKINQRQRYRCNACGKTFMCTRGTAYFYQHKADDWQAYLEKMLEGKTLRRCAEELGISLVTSFNWRHRYMKRPENTYEERLEGIVEADETYFRETNKGERGLARPPRKRGTKASTKGINKQDWVAVLVAMDRNKHEYDHILTTVNGAQIEQYLAPKITQDSILCTDGQPAYNQVCNHHHLHHVVLNQSRIKGTSFHIQNVNAYHQRIKQRFKAMHGVASKYLARYLGWFRMLEWHQYQESEKVLDFKLLQVQQHEF